MAGSPAQKSFDRPGTRAGRAAEADEVYRQALAAARHPESIMATLDVVVEHADVDAFRQLFERLEQLSTRGKTATDFPEPMEGALFIALLQGNTLPDARAALHWWWRGLRPAAAVTPWITS